MTEALVDTHCHLDAYGDPRSVLSDAIRAGVSVVAVTEDPGAYRRLRTRLGPAYGVEVALGLHPLGRDALRPGQSDRFLRMLPETSWIGEIGLDFSRRPTPSERRLQITNFEQVLAHGQAKRVPMTVHSRGAAAETVDRLVDAGVRAVLHWYTGGHRDAERALQSGLYFSVNPAMLRSDRGSALVRLVPPDRILLESDGPYCSHAGRPSTPADLVHVVRELGRLWKVDSTEAAGMIEGNLARMIEDGGS